jgi:hypothetical protein
MYDKSYGDDGSNMAKAGCARVAFPILKGEREGGLRGRLGGVPVSCPRLPFFEGESRPLRGCALLNFSLAKRKDKATHVCLERAMP